MGETVVDSQDTAPAMPAAEPHLRDAMFTFTGRSGEYFRIWIVNVCLTVLTLGIYSAWAKVRTRRYFYRNTILDGHGFDYHARPITILKGRVIAVLIVGGTYAAFAYKPLVGLGLFVGLLLLAPWILNQASRFGARMTSYRNVGFGFAGSYGGAFLAVCVWPIIGAVTFGLLFPLAQQRRTAYLVRNHRFGRTPFAGAPRVGAFYAAYFQALALYFLVFILIAAVGGAAFYALLIGAKASPSQPYEIPKAEMVTMMTWIYAVMVVFFIGPFVHAKTRNAIFVGLTLGPHRFRSRMSGLGYAWMVLVNFVLTVLTLGMLYPWAQIRQARYVAERTTLRAASDLSEFKADASTDGSVAASELAAMEGLAVGLGT
jgi:uncharacterized membrane protein YjgN (DUF898 family)